MINHEAPLFDIDGFKQFLADGMDDVANTAARMFEQQQSSWKPENRGESVIDITHRGYGRFIYVDDAESGPIYLFNHGTKPHRIEAKGKAAGGAEALAFMWPRVGNAQVFVPRQPTRPTHWQDDDTLIIGKGHVDHPGTKDKKLIDDVFDGVNDAIEKFIYNLLNRKDFIR